VEGVFLDFTLLLISQWRCTKKTLPTLPGLIVLKMSLSSPPYLALAGAAAENRCAVRPETCQIMPNQSQVGWVSGRHNL